MEGNVKLPAVNLVLPILLREGVLGEHYQVLHVRKNLAVEHTGNERNFLVLRHSFDLLERGIIAGRPVIDLAGARLAGESFGNGAIALYAVEKPSYLGNCQKPIFS